MISETLFLYTFWGFVAFVAFAKAWFFIGGPFVKRIDGEWCVATTAPKICWESSGRKAKSTGWNKMKDKDVWYTPIKKAR